MKLKKVLAIILAVAVFMCASPLSAITANAATVVVHDIYHTNDFEYYICGGNYCDCGRSSVEIVIDDYHTVTNGVVEIPETIRSFPVTKVKIYNNPNGEVKTLKISKTVKEVDLCSGFENFEVDKNNNYLCSVDGVLYNKSKANLIQYPTENPREAYEILSTVTSIFGYSFAGAENLKKITLPAGLKIINWWAFSGCTGLTSITLPKSITNIYSSVFNDCTNLTDIYYTGTKEAWSKIEISSQNKGLYNATRHYLGLIFDYTVSNSEVTITKCDKSASGYLSIPATIDGYPVTSISPMAFQGCSNITGIYIPYNVTDIGYQAFYGCTNLKSVTLPNSIIKIGNRAFSGCTNLTNINLPDSLTTIDYCAFEDCSKITNITIPKNVTSIGIHPFSDCESLTAINVSSGNRHFTSVNGILFDKQKSRLICYPSAKEDTYYSIPYGVTDILGAFTCCRNLKTIVIPDTVKSIGDSTFRNCTALANITIPNSVTTIGWSAFSGCSSLESIIIPNSVIKIGGYAFKQCESLNSIFIPNSVINMEYIIFQGSPNVVINTTHNSYAEEYAIKNNITVVYYKNGQLVRINANPNRLNANFFVYATGSQISSVIATYANGRYTAEKNGYYTVDISNCTLNTGNMSKLALVPKNTNSYISAVHANGRDILAGELITRDHDKTPVTINVYPASGISVKKYQLLHSNNVISENTDGIFSFTSDLIQQSNDYYVRIIDTSGTTYKKIKINYENKPLIDVELELNELFKVDVPNDVPLIGGTSFELSLDDLPVYTKLEGNSLYIALGVEFDNTKDTINFETYRNFVDKAVKDINQANKMYKKVIKDAEKKGCKFWRGSMSEGFQGSVKTEFFGYCEIQFDASGKAHLKGSNAAVSITGTMGNEWQTAIGVVPFVVKLNGEVGTEISVSIGFTEDNKLHTSGNFDITIPKFTVSAGVGLTKVADVSIYGSGKNVLSFKSVPQQIIGTISGEVGISLKALVWSSKFKFLSGEKEYYNSLNISSYALRRSPLSNSAIVDAFVNEENYVVDRSYLENQSEWLSSPKIQTFSLTNRANDYGISTITELQNNIYDGASPQVITLDSGYRIMVWTADIAERSDYNHTATVYSVYSPETDYWTEPQIIEDDGTADFSPQIATDGNDVFVVWSNANKVFLTTPDMNELASCCEIAYAKFDFENYNFEQAKTLTNDDFYDTNAQVFVNDGSCYISWIKNIANEPLTLEGTNNVYYAIIDDKAETYQFASENALITETAVGILDNKVTIAYTVDTDGDFSTSYDSTIYAAAIGNSPLSISEATEQGNIVFANISQTDKLLWYKDGALVSISEIASAEETLVYNMASSKFEVVSSQNQTALLYSAQSTEDDADGAKLYAQIYNNNSFANPIPVFEDSGAYIQSANGYIDESGNLRVVFLKKNVEFSENSLNEQTSLCDAKIVPNYNLTVFDIFYNEDDVAVGEDFEITAQIKNNGLFDIEGLNVEVIDSDNNIIYSTSLDETLASGNETELKFTMPFPNIDSVKEYTLNIYPSNATEINILDNSVDLTIGYSALSLSVEKIRSGASQSALLTVKNNGRQNEEADLYIYEDDKCGTLLGVYSLGTINAGETAMFNFSPQKLRLLCPESDILYFEVVSNSAEKYTSDNGAYFTYKMVMLDSGDGQEIEYFFDVNDDGEFNISDLVRMHIILSDTENTEQHSGRDVSGDEVLNPVDLLLTRKKVLSVKKLQ